MRGTYRTTLIIEYLWLTGRVGIMAAWDTHTSAKVKLERWDMLGVLYTNFTSLHIPALPFQTHWRRKAAEQRELSAEHYRACWELLSIAGWDRLPGVDGKTVGRHRGNCVRYRNWSLMHLEGQHKKFRLLIKKTTTISDFHYHSNLISATSQESDCFHI